MKINLYLNLCILFFVWLSRLYLIKLSFWYNLESKYKCNFIGFFILMYGGEVFGGLILEFFLNEFRGFIM